MSVCFIVLRRWLVRSFSIFLIASVSHAGLASADSLSGVLVFSSDTGGNPSGWDVGTDEPFGAAYVWRTVPDDFWYGLGVWQGLPPQSFRAAALNAAQFQLGRALVFGRNEFTIGGEEPFLDLGSDSPPSYVLNLYFNGETQIPGLSVLFPRGAVCSGGTAAANPGPAYSLALQESSLPIGPVYDNSVTRISVEAVSFQSSADCGESVDLLSPSDLMPSGRSDYIGVLQVFVEPIAPPPTPTPVEGRCAGDCDGNAAVVIDELLTCVNIALGVLPVDACTACEPNPDKEVTITSIVQAIGNALAGCTANP